MQQVSELYRSLFTSEHSQEYKAVIAGTVYTHAELVSLRTYGGLFAGPDIGCTEARQIDISFFPQGVIPRQAKIELFLRLTDGTRTSEWIPQGVFFFSTRETDRATGVMKVHGFDAMLKSEEIWLNAEYDEENWPMPVNAAVDDIAARMGVRVDPRTSLNAAFPVQYPVDGNDDGEDEDGRRDGASLTMREVLSKIAIANAGNWTITPAGELLLVPLNSIPAAAHYLTDEFGHPITIGGTRIKL